MNALDRLVGTWDLTMHHTSTAEPIRGRETYRPILDGAFVEMHRVYHHPDFPDAIAILSETRSHTFDVRGVVRTFDHRLTDTGWASERPSGDEAFAQRQTVTFTTPDTADGTGEISHDDGRTWKLDFTIHLERVSTDARPDPGVSRGG
ncbi:MAG: hypothetical protein R2698_00550 [Microthrixaceae bacterium]